MYGTSMNLMDIGNNEIEECIKWTWLVWFFTLQELESLGASSDRINIRDLS
jgi:hypothetical protein